MKTIFSVLFVLIAFNSYSQSLYKLPEQARARCSAADSIITNQLNKTVNLYGKVEFEIDGLNVKADQVFFDEKNHHVFAKGLSAFTFDKKVTVSKASKNKTLTYTVGNDTVFIE
jgi:lipopolysaccharide export system protein LptA